MLKIKNFTNYDCYLDINKLRLIKGFGNSLNLCIVDASGDVVDDGVILTITCAKKNKMLEIHHAENIEIDNFDGNLKITG